MGSQSLRSHGLGMFCSVLVISRELISSKALQQFKTNLSMLSNCSLATSSVSIAIVKVVEFDQSSKIGLVYLAFPAFFKTLGLVATLPLLGLSSSSG